MKTLTLTKNSFGNDVCLHKVTLSNPSTKCFTRKSTARQLRILSPINCEQKLVKW